MIKFKRVYFISVITISLLSNAQGPTTTENFIETKIYLDPVSTTNANARQIRKISYFDGLGRQKQLVDVKSSPMGKDVVTHFVYDEYGRSSKKYLPIPQQGTLQGAIHLNPVANSAANYGNEKIYEEIKYDNSSLNRITEKIQSGNDWINHPIQFEYDLNNGIEVNKYVTTTTWSDGAAISSFTLSPSNNGKYPANQLYKNSVTDEDGNVSIEFRNGEGQMLLSRKNDGFQNIDTYYIYNDYDQLVLVIPPMAASAPALNQSVLDNLCYQYRYDARSRLVEKKLPGKGWEFMAYDKADRLILTQDANLRAQNIWLITKYDRYGRPVYSGKLSTNSPRKVMQDQITNLTIVEAYNTAGFSMSGTQVYYTNIYFTGALQSVNTINYYDTYPPGSPVIPTLIQQQPVMPEPGQNISISTKTLPTSTFLNSTDFEQEWTRLYTYYDLKGRVIGTTSLNHLGGYTKTESLLDFTGTPTSTFTFHKRTTADMEVLVKETFEYDFQNRLTSHKHKVDNNPEEILSEITYNELSQVSQKKSAPSTRQ